MKVLYQILLETAKEKGFGENGICQLIGRLLIKKHFNTYEANALICDIDNNKPESYNPHNGYFFPVGKNYELKRIKLIEQRLNFYSNEPTAFT